MPVPQAFPLAVPWIPWSSEGRSGGGCRTNGAFFYGQPRPSLGNRVPHHQIRRANATSPQCDLVRRTALEMSRVFEVDCPAQANDDWFLWRRIVPFGWRLAKSSAVYRYRKGITIRRSMRSCGGLAGGRRWIGGVRWGMGDDGDSRKMKRSLRAIGCWRCTGRESTARCGY